MFTASSNSYNALFLGVLIQLKFTISTPKYYKNPRNLRFSNINVLEELLKVTVHSSTTHVTPINVRIMIIKIHLQNLKVKNL